MTYQPKVSKKKKERVEELKKLFQEYPVIALINLNTLPTLPIQKIKKQLRDKIIIKVTKRRAVLRALEELKDSRLEAIKQYIKLEIGLIFTKEDPFVLYRLLEKGKTNAPAKAGQTAPFDLVIPAGPTNFTPGPMIGELGQLGIKTEVKEGKINIKLDTTVVKEGQEINQKAAEILTKLGIQPMKIGFNVVIVYEKGFMIPKDVLSITEEQYTGMFKNAAGEAINLAINSSYPTQDTIIILVKKAQVEALKVSGEAKYSPEEKKQETKEEPKAEVIKIDKKPEIKEEPEETKLELKQEVKEADIQSAQEIVRKMQVKADPEKKIEKRPSEAETDVNRLIKKLQDKKSRGEI